MSRSLTMQPESTGRPRKFVIALLITAMFLVPMTPMGNATLTSSSFNAEVVSGSNTLSSDAHYNFTFKTSGGNDRAFRVDFPASWENGGGSAAGATAGDNNFAGITSGDDSGDAGVSTGARFFNFTATSDFETGTTENYINVTGINPPRAAGTYTLTATIFNSTGAANGTATDTVTVSATSLAIDLDSDHDDGGSDDMIFGSEATTDYWFDVTWKTGYQHTTDSVNITFDDDFDLSDASVTNGEIDDDEAGYDIQPADDDSGDGSTFTIRVRDVVNPSVTEDSDYTFTAQLRDADGDVVATGSIDVEIIPTALVIDHTGTNTEVEEGKEEDDSVDVRLKTEPAEDVEITIHPGDQIGSDETTLTFTPSNWDDVQKFKLTAVDDSVVEGTTTETLRFTSSSDDATYDDLEATVTASVADDDVGIVLRHTDSKTQVEEGDDDGDTYEVLLSTRPTSSVTITVDPHSSLDVDTTELTFTNTNTDNWNVAQEIEVTSSRVDDSKYQAPVDQIILHTSESTDSDYDALEAELTVTIKDDEHAALGLTEEDIARANKLVELTLTEEDDGIMLEWELPDQEDLDEIFDSDGEITIEGVQVLYSNSPYAIAATFDDGDDEFADAEWLHETDDGAGPRTKYLVTMFFQEDKGLWSTDDVPDTRDSDYRGQSIQEPILPWWGWLLIGIGVVVLILVILLAVVKSQNRRSYQDMDWDDDEDDGPAAAAAVADEAAEETSPAKEKPRKYDLECPVCDHHFKAKGVKPIKTECPDCGAKGVLN